MHSPMFVFNSNTVLLVAVMAHQAVSTWQAARARRRIFHAALARTPAEFDKFETERL